ncbi:hypothetical protein F8388_014979 [Cannabis sativa]|uniref:Uncharacterized protein n=1 Tax=Cannabis sativa TaxID=3483 RepID=A0A7J6DWK4_CANSA|nr:hypothetical protein F8388_014979 [Cannabis sativa]
MSGKVKIPRLVSVNNNVFTVGLVIFIIVIGVNFQIGIINAQFEFEFGPEGIWSDESVDGTLHARLPAFSVASSSHASTATTFCEPCDHKKACMESIDAVISYQHTCLDGIFDSQLKKEILLSGLSNADKLTSNALAIVSSISTIYDAFKIPVKVGGGGRARALTGFGQGRFEFGIGKHGATASWSKGEVVGVEAEVDVALEVAVEVVGG